MYMCINAIYEILKRIIAVASANSLRCLLSGHELEHYVESLMLFEFITNVINRRGWLAHFLARLMYCDARMLISEFPSLYYRMCCLPPRFYIDSELESANRIVARCMCSGGALDKERSETSEGKRKNKASERAGEQA